MAFFFAAQKDRSEITQIDGACAKPVWGRGNQVEVLGRMIPVIARRWSSDSRGQAETMASKSASIWIVRPSVRASNAPDFAPVAGWTCDFPRESEEGSSPVAASGGSSRLPWRKTLRRLRRRILSRDRRMSSRLRRPAKNARSVFLPCVCPAVMPLRLARETIDSVWHAEMARPGDADAVAVGRRPDETGKP
jgi:hypothetical protein